MVDALRLFAAASLLALALACSTASAQAWLPTQGDLDLVVGYSDIVNEKHYLPNGDEADAGVTRSDVVALRFIYGLTDRVSLSGGLPFVRTRYNGGRPHPGDVDDGDVNETLTDWRLAVHYQLTEGPIAFAPYVQYLAPITGYPVLGHAAPGRGLEELSIGFYAGRSFAESFPGWYAQLRYGYAFVEEVVGISHDRSNADLELGRQIGGDWLVRGLLYWQETHGGIDVPIPPSNPLFPYHDQLAGEDFLNAGAGVVRRLGVAREIGVSYVEALRGRNGHKVDANWNVSFTQRFGAR